MRAPQRRIKLLGGRLPAGPILAIGVVLALMLTALVVMMVGDQKAGPARAYEELRAAGVAGGCEDTWRLLADEARQGYGSPDDACRQAAGFNWSGAQVLNVRVHGGRAAILCIAEPLGYGIFFEKIDDRWLADSAAPSMRSECLPESPAEAVERFRQKSPGQLDLKLQFSQISPGLPGNPLAPAISPAVSRIVASASSRPYSSNATRSSSPDARYSNSMASGLTPVKFAAARTA